MKSLFLLVFLFITSAPAALPKQMELVKVSFLEKLSKAKGVRVPAASVAFFGGRHFIVKKAGETLVPIPVQILSESHEFLWVQPLSQASLHDGDSILASHTIYFLTELLGPKEEGS